MISISCVVMFLDKIPITFTMASAEIQKNFCEFEDFEPERMKPQSADDVSDDTYVYLFSSENRQILLAKNRFTFNEYIMDNINVEQCCEKIMHTISKISSIFELDDKFKEVQYRLGVVVEAEFLSQNAAYNVIKDIFGENCNVQYSELELAVNDSKKIQNFNLNSWKRVYINEKKNSFLLDINNHINTPANFGNNKISELYESIFSKELEAVLNAFLL